MECSFSGCDRAGIRAGMCLAHRRQYLHGQQLRPIGRRETNQGKSCSFAGCGRPAYAKGLCKPHRKQVLRGGELRPIGDYSNRTRLFRQRWESMSPEGQRERMAVLKKNGEYPRPLEWSLRLQAAQRVLWADGGPKFSDKTCRCGASFTPRSGKQVWCSFECQQRHRTATRYRISVEELAEIIERQEYRCAICRCEDRLVVDHDHRNGALRGFLCVRCNTGLGKLGDTTATLSRAMTYLSRADTAP